MAVQFFQYTYLIVEGEIDSLQTSTFGGVETYGDDILTANESVTWLGGIGPSSATFLYASGDGLVLTVTPGGQTYLITDTEQTLGTAPPNTGNSYVVCFLGGTLIATPNGPVAIETLNTGDLVLTTDDVAKPIRWLARQTVYTRFVEPLKVMPVRIRAGALGDDLPLRDLFVSPDHALRIDDLLVQAGALVNGSSIVRHTDMPTSFCYFHIELEDHALILAEGVPAETFVDNVSRRNFDNYAEFAALYGDEAICTVEMDHPRVKSARQLPANLKQRLAALAGPFAAAA